MTIKNGKIVRVIPNKDKNQMILINEKMANTFWIILLWLTKSRILFSIELISFMFIDYLPVMFYNYYINDWTWVVLDYYYAFWILVTI